MQQLGTSISQTEAATLNPTQAAQLRALQNQKRVTAYPYYSTVSFAATQQGDIEAGGPYWYEINVGVEARAFSYGIGQPMQNAIAVNGPFPSPPIATPADTNLVRRAETIGGENVEISGIAIFLKHYGIANSANDGEERRLCAAMLAALTSNVSVDLSLNGDQNRFHIGTIQQLPGAGGIVGSTLDNLGIADLQGPPNQYAFAQNGWQTRSNYFRMPEGLIWRQKGNADSELNVIFRVERAIHLWTGGDTNNNFAPAAQGMDRAADYPNGIQGYRYPTIAEVVLCVQLMGRVVGDRTRSA